MKAEVAAILMVAFSAMSHAQSTSSILSGVGNLSCQDYQEVIKREGKEPKAFVEQVISWSQGYLSGKNSVLREAAKKDIPSREFISAYVDDWCRKYPPSIGFVWLALDSLFENRK